MEITDRRLLNDTVTTGEEVVVRVDLANHNPIRGRITLNLTANRSLVAQRTVTVGFDAQRTVHLRAVPRVPGRYEMRLDGVPIGTLEVTATATDTASRSPTNGGSTETMPGTAAPTGGSTVTDGKTPTGEAETGATQSSEWETGVATGPEAPGPDEPTGTEAIVALGMSLLLLYGVGLAVYVLQE